MVQKRETKAISKLCVREILSLSFVCRAYFFEFRGRNLVCSVIAYNFNGKYAPEAGKTRMRTAFFTRVMKHSHSFLIYYVIIVCMGFQGKICWNSTKHIAAKTGRRKSEFPVIIMIFGILRMYTNN